MTDTPQRPSPLLVNEERESQMMFDGDGPPGNLEAIREEVNKLAASDKLDKDSALTMTRLFHAIETLMRQECTRRDAEISRMEYEIERTRIQSELDRITNVQIHQQQQQVESTPMRRVRSKW